MARTADKTDIPNRLTKAGRELFSRHGYNATGIQQITDHAGVANDRIRPALNILAVNDLVHTERFTSSRAEGGVAHAYRLTHLDGNRHLGTIGRDGDFDLGLPVEDMTY